MFIKMGSHIFRPSDVSRVIQRDLGYNNPQNWIILKDGTELKVHQTFSEIFEALNKGEVDVK